MNTWKELRKQYPVKDSFINRMKELETFWHNNSTELTTTYRPLLQGAGEFHQRQWTTQAIGEEWVTMLNKFYQDVFESVPNEDTLVVIQMASTTYRFSYSTDQTKLPIWTALSEALFPILKDAENN